ncbi:hypothetical protein EFR36_08330 [Latilactobacillus curvatus]|nr:hypothetical protein [Latilactobacillus curvatus]
MKKRSVGVTIILMSLLLVACGNKTDQAKVSSSKKSVTVQKNEKSSTKNRRQVQVLNRQLLGKIRMENFNIQYLVPGIVTILKLHIMKMAQLFRYRMRVV